MTKPILRRFHNIWVCGVVNRKLRIFYWPIGHGSAPKEAYDDWRAQL